MLFKELSRSWPPLVRTDSTNIVKADLKDIIVSAQNRGGGKLALRLRKPGRYGAEYEITLRLPEDVLQRTIFAVMRKRDMTLREVGELTIQ